MLSLGKGALKHMLKYLFNLGIQNTGKERERERKGGGEARLPLLL